MNLGKGSFGQVIADGNSAVKYYKDINHLVGEVFVTRYVSDSPYCISLKKCSFEKLTMTVERWECSLDKAISAGLTSYQKVKLHISILKGLAHLESLFIVHADIKPSNILVNKNLTKAAICDFGISSTSNSAKVRLTSPAFALPEGKVRSHRTHDMFSFVILTLQLMYNKRPTKILQTRSELRRLVSSTVSNTDMKRALCMLILDDLHKCWTAKRALYELYNKKAHLPTFKVTLFDTDDEDQKLLIFGLIRLMNQMHFFRKRTRCVKCTISIVSSLDVDKEKAKLYSVTMSYLFCCLFGFTVKVPRDERMSIFHIMKYVRASKSDIFVCLNTILSRKDIINLIFAP